MNFLETNQPKKKESETLKVIDLNSPAESPKRTVFEVNEEINVTEEDEKLLEEKEIPIAPAASAKSETVTAKDNTITARQPEEAATTEAVKKKEQNR